MGDTANQQERLAVITEEQKWFMAGFIEGEGSYFVGLKFHPTARFGVMVDPDFFLYQHECRRELLEMAAQIFGTGRIYPKPGNEVVLTYHISSRWAVRERVLPFVEKYMRFSAKQKTIGLFRKIVEALDRKKHATREGLIKIVKMAYQMNPEGKGRKRPQEEVIARILRDYTPESPKAT